MEIKIGDYVRYKGKVYSVIRNYCSCFDLVNYKDLEVLEAIPKSEVERLTNFHVSIMRYNKSLPNRRFKVGDRVKLRVDLDSECVYPCIFRTMGFREGTEYTIDSTHYNCRLRIGGCNAHEFEVELVD